PRQDQVGDHGDEDDDQPDDAAGAGVGHAEHAPAGDRRHRDDDAEEEQDAHAPQDVAEDVVDVRLRTRGRLGADGGDERGGVQAGVGDVSEHAGGFPSGGG